MLGGRKMAKRRKTEKDDNDKTHPYLLLYYDSCAHNNNTIADHNGTFLVSSKPNSH